MQGGRTRSFKNGLSRAKKLKELELKVKVRLKQRIRSNKGLGGGKVDIVVKNNNDNVSVLEKEQIDMKDIERLIENWDGEPIAIGHDWFVLFKDEQTKYFFNSITGSAMINKHPFGLEENWRMQYDRSTSKFYYYHEESGETRWERPVNVNR